MAKFTRALPVTAKRKISDEYFVLTLQGGEEVRDILPGQFVQVRVDGSSTTFLRRPVSVYDIDPSLNTIDLLIKIVGDGTRTLSVIGEGTNLSLIYPLGNSFTFPAKDDRILLIGGGVGVAPLYFAGKHFAERGCKPTFLLGYRTADQVIEHEKFSAAGEVLITTEDGTMGHRGLVTSHPVLESGDAFDKIYCCGPDPMMRAVADYAYTRNIECEVSLENLMACGIGVCLCCIEDTIRGNVCTCTEGPVFNIKELKWQI